MDLVLGPPRNDLPAKCEGSDELDDGTALEHAAAVMIEHRGCTRDEAVVLLALAAHEQNRTLWEIARDVVNLTLRRVDR